MRIERHIVRAKQIHKEDTILKSGTDQIVTDSPILLQYYYAALYDAPAKQHLLGIAKEFEKHYPSINICLQRKDRDYQTHGRYQNLEESKAIDKGIRDLLDTIGVEYVDYSYYDKEKIIKYITDNVNE